MTPPSSFLAWKDASDASTAELAEASLAYAKEGAKALAAAYADFVAASLA
jgi:hypothetical protein